MVYPLQRPSIEMIIDYYRDLLADEKLEVYEFGQNCDLVLHIYRSRKIITKEKIMRIKDLIEQLSMYEENSEVIIYDDDNDREYEIAAIDADEGYESDNDPQIMIIF